MRVALNAWFWERPDTGSGQYARRLVEHLGAVAPEIEVDQLRPEGRRSAWAKLRFEQIGFPRASAHRGADVAHVPYWGPPLTSPVPTVVTVHDLIPLLLRPYQGGLLGRAYTALVTTGAENAALVLTDSQASRRDILAHLRVPPERVRAIPLAADGRYRPEPGPEDGAIRTRYGVPERYVLYLGGCDVRKNLVTALRAFRWIGPALGDDCPLVVAGRLPAEDTAFAPDPRRQARELDLEPDWVHFIDRVAEAEKPALYRGAVAFVFPSRYEGFGLPPLEAMACGTPVVGSDAASLPEVVGDAGVLLPPDDAAGMAGALIQLAEDEDFRAEMGRRALAQAATFSWERTARETAKAYRQVAEQGS
jgi:glycosyltransferase involved in cell wall biosynthesis